MSGVYTPSFSLLALTGETKCSFFLNKMSSFESHLVNLITHLYPEREKRERIYIYIYIYIERERERERKTKIEREKERVSGSTAISFFSCLPISYIDLFTFNWSHCIKRIVLSHNFHTQFDYFD